MTNIPKGTVTFLFTDIQGSTKLWEDSPAAMQTALEQHDNLLRQAIENHNGYVFKTVGDAFCAAFASPHDALDAALAGRRALSQAEWPTDTGELLVRLALHTGRALHRDNDYFGPSVNRVARLVAAAHGGQIVMSRATQERIQEQLPAQIQLTALGEHRLKDLYQPEHVFQAIAPDLPHEFPPLNTFDSLRTNLPAQTSPLIGRSRELAAMTDLLRTQDIRLVTLAGPGGIGKTRLSLQIAADLLDDFDHGVFLVELAPISNPDNIAVAIAEATGYPFQSDGRASRQQILDFLREKRMLLILDNFEHVLDGAPLLTKILQAAPSVKLLVTSRHRLQLTAETLFMLEGMAYPESQQPDPTSHYEAIDLFLQQAHRMKPDFDLSDKNTRHIIEICQLVQGMPLGIILAASWVKMLTPEEIAQEIQQNISFLESQGTDLPERQRSLRAVYEYSWTLMAEAERQLFSRLSIFRGGFTRAAAEKIAGAELHSLRKLHDLSLLQRDSESGRYSLHELLRQYAEEKLTSSEQESTQEAYAAYFANFIREREIDLKGRAQVEGLIELEADIENVRLAWRWAVDHRRDDLLDLMVEGLKLFCDMRDRIDDRRTFFIRSRDTLFPQISDDPPRLWCRMMVRHAGFMSHQGDLRSEFQTCLEMAQRRGDLEETAYCLLALGDAHTTLHDPQAVTLYKESLEAYQELDDKFYITHVLNRLGAIHLFIGQVDAAREFGQQAVDYGRQSGNRIDTGWALHTVASFYTWKRDHGQAAPYLEEARDIWVATGNRQGLANVLYNLALDSLRQSKVSEARVLADEALAMARSINNPTAIGGPLAALSTIECWAGEYKNAFSLGLEAIEHLQASPPGQAINFSSLAAATILMKDYDKARHYIHEALLHNQRINQHWHIVTIALFTLILASENRGRRAVELLGLCDAAGGPSYFESWPPLVRLPDQLKADLGDDVYNAAWEASRSLDIDKVVAEVLEATRPS